MQRDASATLRECSRFQIIVSGLHVVETSAYITLSAGASKLRK